MKFVLVHSQARARAIQAIKDAPQGWQVTLTEPRRSLDQNAAQWPILQAFSEQLLWPVNGRKIQMSPDEWKDVLTASFEEYHRVAEGLNGGKVMLGAKTRQWSKHKFSEWLDFLNATAVDRGVNISGGSE